MRRALQAAPSTLDGEVASPVVIAPLMARDGRLNMPRLTRPELGLLALFALVSLWVLGCDLWQTLVHGLTWTGTDGVYISDQAQYLGWIESAAHSGLIANLFVLHPTAAVYFQPAITLSGLLVDLGVAPSIALLLWKPVAVVGLFIAARVYVVEVLPKVGSTARLVVLSLALFYGCFSSVYGSFGVVGDLFPGFLAWGYPFALLGIACSLGALVTYARARAHGRLTLLPALLAALASSLHPWQGEVLVLVLLGGELTGGALRNELRPAARSPRLSLQAWGASERARLWAATVAGGVVPLLYYYSLGKFDPSWALGQEASKHAFPAVAIGLALAPLSAVALLGLRRGGGFLRRTAWLWPLAAVLVYLQSYTSQGATPLHAFDGVTLPLGVLAVDGCLRCGWRRLPHHRLLAALLVLLFTVPTTWYEMKEARLEALPTSGNGNFIRPAERRALAWLRTVRQHGGVITRSYLGALVPGFTGRHSLDGDCIWSEPDCSGRSNISRSLLLGQLPVAEARQLVTSSHARFVLADCSDNSSRLATELAPLVGSIHRFGCATVYEIKT